MQYPWNLLSIFIFLQLNSIVMAEDCSQTIKRLSDSLLKYSASNCQSQQQYQQINALLNKMNASPTECLLGKTMSAREKIVGGMMDATMDQKYTSCANKLKEAAEQLRTLLSSPTKAPDTQSPNSERKNNRGM